MISDIKNNIIAMLLMVSTAILTMVLHPSEKLVHARPPVNYAAIVPSSFSDWKEMKTSTAQIIDPQQRETLDRIYSQTVGRTYVNSNGYRIMLSLAYGETQRGNMQLHHPEVCYPAQGFAVRTNKTGAINAADRSIPVRRLETAFENSRYEPVTYWALVGSKITLGSFSRKIIEIQHGLKGEIADGMLFRISSIDRDSEFAFRMQEKFVLDLVSSLSKEDQVKLIGTADE
jgi:EpsI family protein